MPQPQQYNNEGEEESGGPSLNARVDPPREVVADAAKHRASGTTHSAARSHLLVLEILADRIERILITRIPRAAPPIAGMIA